MRGFDVNVHVAARALAVQLASDYASSPSNVFQSVENL